MRRESTPRPIVPVVKPEAFNPDTTLRTLCELCENHNGPAVARLLRACGTHQYLIKEPELNKSIADLLIAKSILTRVDGGYHLTRDADRFLFQGVISATLPFTYNDSSGSVIYVQRPVEEIPNLEKAIIERG